jgi:hypothetical protein
MSHPTVSPLEAMQINYTIDEGRGLVTFRLRGVADIAETRRALEELRADPRFRPGMDVVTDRRELEEAPTSRYTEELLSLVQAHWPPSLIRRWAILTRPGAGFGMARMAELRAALAGTEVGSFLDESEALEWLLRPGLVP